MSLPATLAQLIALNFIRPQAEEDYVFGHVLIQEAVYQTLLKADRRTLHQCVGEVLANVPAAAGTLAAHFREAGELGRAVQYFLQAGAEALANYANVEAEGHYQQAARLIPVATQPELAARAWDGVGQAQARQSRFAEAQASWQQALALFERLNQWSEWAWVAGQIVSAAGFGGDWAKAWALGQQWVQASAAHPETAGLAALLQHTASAGQRNALYDDPWALSRQALGIAERTGNLPERINILTQQGYVLIGSGQIAEATATLTEALALAQAANLPHATAPIHGYLAQLERDAHHNLPVALDHFMRAAQTAARTGSATRQIFNLAFAVELLYGLGQARRAEALWQEVLAVRRSLPDPRVLVPAMALVEATHWQWHEYWEATTATFQTMETETRQRHELQYLAIGLWLGGHYWMGRGELQLARTKLLEALTWWEGSATNYLGLYYSLSRVHSQLGDVPTAWRWWAEAARLAPHTRPHWRDGEGQLEAEAFLALAEGRPTAAWQYFAAAAKHVVSFGAYGLLADVLALWAQACEQQGFPTQAQQLRQHRATLRAAAANDEPLPAVNAIMQHMPNF